MAGSRTLKLSILADVDDLNRKLKQADNDVGGFTGQLEKFGKMAAAAFAAATAAAVAYAGKLAVDGVKAAIEDEAAQRRLAQALEAATGATTKQIAETEKFISQMQLATGVADTDLRNALGRLALSTNDLTKAQDLLSLALDISKARQIPLETVANALGKAYDGQTTALARLGLGFSSAEVKGKSFSEIQDMLTKSFGGAASDAAQTYQGRIDRLKQAFAEFQEGIGYKLLPILERFLSIITDQIIPNIGKFLDIFKPIGDAIERNKESFLKFGELLEKYVIPILAVSFANGLRVVADVAGFVIDVIGKVASGITSVVNGAISAINVLIKAYNAIPFLPNVSTIGGITPPTISVPKVGSTSAPGSSGGGSTFGGGGTSTSIAGVSTAVSSVGGATQDLFGNTLSAVSGARTSGAVTDPNVIAAYKEVFSSAGNPITVNIGVAGDPEGTARTIVDVLNRSYGRGALGAENLLL